MNKKSEVTDKTRSWSGTVNNCLQTVGLYVLKTFISNSYSIIYTLKLFGHLYML